MGTDTLYANKIKRYLKERNCYCIEYSQGILACVNGHFMDIKVVNADNGKPTWLQLIDIDAIRWAGGFACVAYPSGWQKLKAIIDDLLLEEFNRKEDIVLDGR